MSGQAQIMPPPIAQSTASDNDDRDSASGIDAKQPVKETATVTGLATAETQRTEAVLGDYVLRFFGIRKGPKKDIYDVDAVRDNRSPNNSQMQYVDLCRSLRNQVSGTRKISKSSKASTSIPNGKTGPLSNPTSAGAGGKRTQSAERWTGRSWYGETRLMACEHG